MPGIPMTSISRQLRLLPEIFEVLQARIVIPDKNGILRPSPARIVPVIAGDFNR